MATHQKKQYGFRAPEPLSESIESFATENNMSQSDALRQLVRSGLEVEEMREEVEALEQRVEQLESDDGGWWPPF